ncbi:uncharacterized protein L201_004659 [Kwoniella dendrophila CBS 6074]|uniref:rRNA-processing protein FYV7 n=1 Tax=Kwoniella dendrophila CBS 6074 TaxID=1295534 RepID=A0AAX4JXW4_9TREE
MPRVTKKQKEAGKTVKPKPKNRSGGNNGGGKQGGFNVKPSRAPKDAYMGKAQKIKADLIQRAKMKKSYAKILKAEGISDSSRLGDGSRRRNERPSENDNNDNNNDSRRGKGKDGNNSSGGGKFKSRGERENDETKRLESRAGPAPGSRSSSSSNSYSGSKSTIDRKTYGSNRLDRQKSNSSLRQHDKPPHQRKEIKPPSPKRVRALSLSPPPTSTTDITSTTGQPIEKKSFRDMKKEAFSKYHKSRNEAPASIGGSGRSNKRGQPNMGARMGLLLEKIKGNVK